MKNKTNKFYEYEVLGCTVRITDKSIKTQNMEILKNKQFIGNITEVVDRIECKISVWYNLKGDLFDSLEEAIDALLYNLNK